LKNAAGLICHDLDRGSLFQPGLAFDERPRQVAGAMKHRKDRHDIGAYPKAAKPSGNSGRPR